MVVLLNFEKFEIDLKHQRPTLPFSFLPTCSISAFRTNFIYYKRGKPQLKIEETKNVRDFYLDNGRKPNLIQLWGNPN